MRDPEFQELDLEYLDEHPKRPGGRPDLWQRLSRLMEGVLYLLILAAVARIFWPEVEHQRELNTQLAQIEKVREDQETRVAHLQMEYELLKSDRDYIESVARDRLNLYRPGANEYVVRIQRQEEPPAVEQDGESGE